MATIHQFPQREKDSLIALLIVDDSPESTSARSLLAATGVPFIEKRSSEDYDPFAAPVMPYLKAENRLFIGMGGIEQYLTALIKK